MDMRGKTVLITGGSRGMGQQLALKLGAKGANVVVNYRRDDESAQKTVAEIEAVGGTALALKADISDTESVQQLVDAAVERFGRLDVVVANAAASAFKPLMDIRAHHIEKTMGITIQGFLDLVRISLPHMRNGGRVLAVSGWDSFRALPLHGLLGAAKAGMESIVRNLAVELAGDGVTAVGVCPGPIDTDSFRLYAGDSWDDYAKNWLTQTPSGAYATPSEVADVMAFLCSPESVAINGQTIVVDGGLSVATMPIGFGQN
ncbi:2-hydroxycyclohexanecarboxyl-CoA dehydrogenase [Rhodococcus opacus PD630]|nr:Enoyl-[acyl-carrier-protein] reductase [NADPH] FabL [Rhodococcus opacus PD630]EHI45024.1 2-hydroxycyclohexanecarboxyl-CoA dehydrogenase [Rhodococcus opacus PD630]KXF54919.1 dehydrogenase [Rhodococcus sp. SC4]KXX56550.1 dehydrogenase [Rhodococcus sp. LB1]